jgi:MoxR-vWA-beta-propeller ternary system domain bpX6
LALFTSGSRLLRMPDDRWLLVLAVPVRLFADAAPGLPFVLDRHRWVASPDLFLEIDSSRSNSPAIVAWIRGGDRHEARLDSLTVLDPSQWLDLGVPIVEGMALEPVAVPTIKPAPIAAPVDLRSIAGIGATPEATKAMMQSMSEEARRQRQNRNRQASPTIDPFGKRSTPRPPSKLASALAKLVLKSPASKSISKKHEQYLNDLRSRFAAGDFESALKRAIPFGGKDGEGSTALGTPGARDQLTFGARSGGARMVPYGPDVSRMLADMYRSAATDLEAQERYFEAAYVLAELMDEPMSAVSMLERNKQWKLGAEIARSYNMDPDLLVRMQWLAGDKAAALRTARRHGNYAAVINKVAAVDPIAARDLRVHWVNDLELSGRYVQAVQVGWEEPELRPSLRNVIDKAARLDDSAKLSMQAYGLHLDASDDQVLEFEETMKNEVQSGGRGMRQLVLTMSTIGPLPSAAADRQIASSVLRSLFLLGQKRPYDQQFTRATRVLIDRCDPLLKADLGSFEQISHRADGPVELTPLQPGVKPILDAAATAGGEVLVAFGETGCALLNSAGRITASWSIPTHSLVMSDSGTMALLLTKRDPSVHVYFLDLATRKTKLYGTVALDAWADSFDGATWAVQFKGTLAFLDMFAHEPSLGWTQFEHDEYCHTLSRSEERLTAVITSSKEKSRERVTEVWSWSLPLMSLVSKQSITCDPRSTLRVAVGGLYTIWLGAGVGAALMQVSPGQTPVAVDQSSHAASWNGEAFMASVGSSRFELRPFLGGALTTPIDWTPSGGIRIQAGPGKRIVALWDGSGRLYLIDQISQVLLFAHSFRE